MEINENKLKIILKEQREEYQRYMGALAENFESQVKLIVELVMGIQEQLIALREMVAKNTEDITLLKEQLIALREMATKNTEDIEIIKIDIHIIKNDLKEKVTRDELIVLEKRVMFLEKKFQSI
ncbi:hypothetical protein KJ973_01340 [Patescibacteria group bacterium]|nr:hypothetical protein [Patescibacteria group bacterium]MBU1519324.1 hypothetical protein [Patescibacteria group bacterium]MBU2461062.1 hypothetical protein [Patescibacteria group bacterium]